MAASTTQVASQASQTTRKPIKKPYCRRDTPISVSWVVEVAAGVALLKMLLVLPTGRTVQSVVHAAVTDLTLVLLTLVTLKVSLEQALIVLTNPARLLCTVGHGCPPGQVAEDDRQHLAGQTGVAVEANGRGWAVEAGQPVVVALAALRAAQDLAGFDDGQ